MAWPDEVKGSTDISLRTIREQKLLSKAELARLAGVSSLTIDRIERGHTCRPDTLRKLILALGYNEQDKAHLFADIPVFNPKAATADA